MGFEGLTSVTLLDNDKVFAAFNFCASMTVDANDQMMSSNDWAMNVTIGFSVWYSARNFVKSAAVEFHEN